MQEISIALAEKTIEDAVHKRKWSLLINGLKGPEKENSRDTREACFELAQKHLKITNPAEKKRPESLPSPKPV